MRHTRSWTMQGLVAVLGIGVLVFETGATGAQVTTPGGKPLPPAAQQAPPMQSGSGGGAGAAIVHGMVFGAPYNGGTNGTPLGGTSDPTEFTATGFGPVPVPGNCLTTGSCTVTIQAGVIPS